MEKYEIYKFTDGTLTMDYYGKLDTFELYYLVKGKNKHKSIQPMMTLSERQFGWMEQYDSPHVGNDKVISTSYVQLSF